jgi:putative hydrolase of the HAD superfamily
MLRAVCFDLDGTLFDDRQYIRAGFCEAAQFVEGETGADIYDSLLEALFDHGIDGNTFDHVLNTHDLPSNLVSPMVEAYHDHGVDLDPYSETITVLRQLDRQYETGLISGGTNGRSKIDRLGLAPFFDAVLITPELDTTKRDAEPFERMLELLGVRAAETVYVGDRPELDFPRPNELGMYTVRVRTGRYADTKAIGTQRPNTTIDRLDELPDALSEFVA